MLPFHLKPSSREHEQTQKGESAETTAVLKKILLALEERILFWSSLDLLWKMVSENSGKW